MHSIDAIVALLATALMPSRVLAAPPSPMPGVTNVFVICHSHDDVGWLKTPQQYFTGSNVIGIDPDGENLPSVYYANGAVQFILTSVVQSLNADPARVFTVVEQYFFQRWYLSQDASTQQLVTTLVANQQLVFANGGIVMHDEANPTYIDMIDQTTAGVRWIAQTFGTQALPRAQSQLDPFGHSATHVSYLAGPSAGYMGTFHARMDYEEVSQRASTRTMDFGWAPSSSLGVSAATMGALGYFGYSPPSGLCLDIGIECQGEAFVFPTSNPLNDDSFYWPDGEDNNVADFVTLVIQTAQAQANAYPRAPDGTVLLPWTMGDDFQWQAAQQYFQSVDKMMAYVNANTSQHGIHMLYATQASYAAARIAASAAQPLALKVADGFPYADGPHDVWSGYFTSRPALKAFVRDCSAMFQAAKQLQAWAEPPTDTSISNPLWLLETAVAIAQHHDAVAGTAKQVVSYDYAKRLQAGRDSAGVALSRWLNIVSGVSGTPSALVWSNCDLANATICPVTEAAGAANSTVALNIYNAGSQARTGVRGAVRVPVPTGGAGSPASWAVIASDGVTHLAAQLVPASPADVALRTTYYNVTAASMSWLCFFVNAPAAGFVTVFLQPAAGVDAAPLTAQSVMRTVTVGSSSEHGALRSADANPTLTNGIVTLTLDATTGLLSSFASTDPSGAASVALSQNLYYYTSSQGDAADSQKSGAYIFRPVGNSSANVTAVAASVTLSVLSGPIVSEAWQTFADWASQVVRLWTNATDSFEVQYDVGPIPMTPLLGPGKEVVSRWTAAGWQTNATWFTDANAREMQRRVRNSRPDYPLQLTEPVALNYYPVNSAARMVDATSRATFTLVTSVSQGCSSGTDGELDVMLHRRLAADDSRGVLEALDEPGVNLAGLVVRNVHRIILSRSPVAAALAHKAAVQDAALLPLQLRAAALPSAPSAWLAAGAVASASLLAAPLPPNAHLLTLHAWNSSTLLLRLAHLFESSDAANAGNVTLSLAALLNPALLTLTGVTEMTTTAGEPLAQAPTVTYTFSTAAPTSGAAVTTVAAEVPLPQVRHGHAPDNSRLAEAITRHRDADARRDGSRDDFTRLRGGVTQTVTLPIVPPAPTAPAYNVVLGAMEIRTFLCTYTWTAPRVA